MLFCFVTYDVLMIGYQHCHSTTFGLYTGLNVRHLFGCFWRHFQISNHHVCYCDRKILPPHDSFASSSSRGQAWPKLLSSPHYNAKSKPPDSVITSTHIFWISCIFFVLHSVIVCRSCIKIYSSSISIKVILYIFIIFNCQFFIFHLYFLTCSTCIPSPYYVHCYVLKHWSTFHVCATQLCKTPDSHSVWCLFSFPQEAASTTSRMFFSHLSPVEEW